MNRTITTALTAVALLVATSPNAGAHAGHGAPDPDRTTSSKRVLKQLAKAKRATARFRDVETAKAELTRAQSALDTDATSITRYQGFADVTSSVASGGSGVYTVGNVATGTGENRFGGWGLVVVYRNSAEPTRRLLVYDGLLAVQSGLRLVKRAARDGKPVVIVNRGVTRGDELATLRLNAGTSQALEHLAARLP